MNLNIFNVATQGVAALGSALVNEDQNRLKKYAIELVDLPDEDLRARCRETIRGEDTGQVVNDESFLRAISSYLIWSGRRADSLTVKRIALAVEAFKRAPADLPPGTALYPQQVQAAISLTKHCLIQMDTGEGKTYALLPSAFALACEFHRTYIVCANEYLAWRDATRTRKFWEFVGLPHSLCLKYDSDWSARVIYTTLSALIFKHLSDVGTPVKPKAPVSFGAILLDEADAILLDEGENPFSLVEEIRADAFDWSFALDYAQSLVEGEEIETDRSKLDANLTVAGEKRLRETLGDNGRADSVYLMTRSAVELAFVAVRIAIQDRDYILEDGRIYSVDPVSGKLQRYTTPHWVTPLEVQMHLKPRPEHVDVDQITTLTFLRKFQHLSGLSGTIVDDALEYLFLYKLPTLIIKPRRKRQRGVKPDLVLQTTAESYEEICKQVLQAVEENRPVLIGTQSIADAEAIYVMLSRKLSEGTRLNLLTGKNDHEAAEIFEQAGEVGSVLVATQLAGRGVDIRLSEAARQNGGLILLCLSHSMTIRHDKQFLGRAGRQGDPYVARFVCSLEDELYRQFAGERVATMMQKLGLENGVAIESSWVTKQIGSAQNNYRQMLFWQDQQQALLHTNSFDIRRSLESWIEYLQLPAETNPSVRCSSDFLEWVVGYYIDNVAAGMFAGRKNITGPEAEQIVRALNSSLNLQHSPFSPLDIEAQDAHGAAQILQNLLLKKLNDATANYEKLMAASFTFQVPQVEANGSSVDFNGLNQMFSGLFTKGRQRTPRNIAFWSIRSGWMSFIQDRRRIIQRVYQKRLPYLEHFRRITDQISTEWDKREREIAVSVIRNLLKSDRSDELDQLFVFEDNRVVSSSYQLNDNLFKWDPSGTQNHEDALRPEDNIRQLIVQFVGQSGNRLNDSFSASHLRRLLVDFFHKNPLETLQNPSQILAALENWGLTENELGVSSDRKKANHKWLRAFLIFLHQRKLLAALPTFKTRLRYGVTRFVRTMSETRTAMAFVGVTSFLGLFLLVLYFGAFAQPKHFGAFGKVFDEVLFAGLLSAGNIAAPAFTVLILASLITIFIFPITAERPLDAVPFGRYLALLLAVAFSWWLTDWHFGNFTVVSLLRSFVVFGCILLVTLTTKQVCLLLKNTVNLDLTAGWLVYGVLFLFLHVTGSGLSGKLLPIFFLVGAATAFYFWQRLNDTEIELVSTLLSSSSTSMQVETISGNLTVKADCGPSPHIYAILSALLLYEFVVIIAPGRLTSLGSILLMSAVYLGVVSFQVVYVLNRRFSPVLWEADLNERHQTIKDIRDEAELHQKLKKTKQLLTGRELTFQLIILVLAVFLFRNSFLLGTTFPLALLFIAAAALFSATSRDFGAQLYGLFYNRTPIDIEVLDLSRLPEETKQRSNWRLVKRIVKVTFAACLSILGFLEFANNAYDVLKKLNIIR